MAKCAVSQNAQISGDKGTGWKAFNWKSLDDELALWSQQGRKATFWWRDDDACSSTAELETLLRISEEFSVPVSLAIVPDKLEDDLCVQLSGVSRISVLQHGYAHNSHAPAAEKKAEYGAHRPVDAMLHELEHGRTLLQHAFGDQFLSVLVPPWNRYSIELLPLLSGRGFRGLSAMWARFDNPLSMQNQPFSKRQSVPAVSRFLQVNTHIDPVAWRFDRGFIGENDALGQLVCHLRLRREFPQLGDEPTGLLSHHLDQTESVWEFCRRFADKINIDDNCCWLSAGDIWR